MRKEQEAWLERNTFRCAVGRVAPKQCEELRGRPTVEEITRSVHAHVSPAVKPRVCEWCTDWAEKIREFEGRTMAEKDPTTVTVEDQTEAGRTEQADGWKICKACQEKKASTEFYPDRKATDGLRSICKECDKARQRARRARKKSGRDVGASAAAPPPPATAARSAGDVGTQVREALTLDFRDYPEILEKIKAAAKEEMRTPEMQALWILRSWLMGEFRHIERDRDGGPVGIPRHPVIWCVQDGGMEGHDEG